MRSKEFLIKAGIHDHEVGRTHGTGKQNLKHTDGTFATIYLSDLLSQFLDVNQGMRFELPTNKQLIEFAIIFNDGKLEPEKLGDMVAMTKCIIDRLFENGDILKPSSRENHE